MLGILAVMGLVVFGLVAAVNETEGQDSVSSASYVSAHTTLQLLSISVSLSVFAIRWTYGRLSKNLPNLLAGAALLAVGLFHLFHVLTYPGLLQGSEYSTYDISTHFRLIARLTLVAALLILAFVPFRRKADQSDSIFILLGVVVLVLVTLYLVMVRAESLPSLYAENGGLTAYGAGLSLACVSLFVIGALRYAYLGGAEGEATHFYIAAALIIGAFGEVSFSVHGRADDLAHVVAHTLEFGSFLILFLALLRESVAMPFETLAISRKVHERDQEDLKLKSKEAEEAKLRAQAHLDFLAHDVSNIISPIVSYSEMLLANKDITPQQRKYLEHILRQGQRGGVFAANLRRLADAEAVPPDAFVGVDLVTAIETAEEVVRSTHKNKTISATKSIPADGQAVVPGGEHIENVIYEILKEAVEDAPGDNVKVSITFRIVKDRRGRNSWQIAITLYGHEFSPETISEAKVIYDTMRGIRRGVASNYAFYSSIVNHFGGSLEIENLPLHNGAPSRRVTVMLPAVETLM